MTLVIFLVDIGTNFHSYKLPILLPYSTQERINYFLYISVKVNKRNILNFLHWTSFVAFGDCRYRQKWKSIVLRLTVKIHYRIELHYAIILYIKSNKLTKEALVVDPVPSFWWKIYKYSLKFQERYCTEFSRFSSNSFSSLSYSWRICSQRRK
jgi:hypothetical protein